MLSDANISKSMSINQERAGLPVDEIANYPEI